MAVPIVPIFSSGDYEAQVARAAELLRAGRIVVLPTETVYGAAGVLTNPDARQRLQACGAAAAAAVTSSRRLRFTSPAPRTRCGTLLNPASSPNG